MANPEDPTSFRVTSRQPKRQPHIDIVTSCYLNHLRVKNPSPCFKEQNEKENHGDWSYDVLVVSQVLTLCVTSVRIFLLHVHVDGLFFVLAVVPVYVQPK